MRRNALLSALFALGLAVPAAGQSVSSGSSAVLRGLDRLSGERQDISVRVGENTQFGRLAVRVSDCRFPTDNPAGDAFAYVVVADTLTGTQLFEGWMIASAPALNALDHMRYDLWVLRCSSS